MPQQPRSAPEYDVAIVGSGAGGGTAARVLAEKGLKVALLEAGPMLDVDKHFHMFDQAWDYDHRGAGKGGKQYFGDGIPFGFFSTTMGGWELEGEPYTTADGTEFRWFRSRVVGGRTNHYGRMSFRFSQLDFKAYSRDGVGYDWPIDYDEISPYYDKAEEFIGVTGDAHGIPSAPDGKFHTPPAPKAHELLIRKAGKKLGVPFIANRRAVITRAHNGRPACHYCGQCGRGCSVNSNYSASLVDVFPAVATGNVRLYTDAMVREVTTDGNNKATGIIYVDKNTRQERFVKARAVMIGASACESVRILLNSKTKDFPNGVANSSGHVGRYLMDTVGFGLSGYVPALEGLPHYDTDGFGGAHLYAPWWEYDNHNKLDFPRGYHIEIGGGFGQPRIGWGSASRRFGYGAEMKKAMRERYGTTVGFAGRGEMIPNNLSYCELDPDGTVDKWGIPVLRFQFRFSDYEWKQARHMEKTFAEIIDAMGGRVLGLKNANRESSGISVPGTIIHEVGGARMGNNPKESVVDKYCRAHDCKNLYMVDGASFVTNPDKNPTLTINAFSWRASDHLAEEMRKGNV